MTSLFSILTLDPQWRGSFLSSPGPILAGSNTFGRHRESRPCGNPLRPPSEFQAGLQPTKMTGPRFILVLPVIVHPSAFPVRSEDPTWKLLIDRPQVDIGEHISPITATFSDHNQRRPTS